jgi:hypothetical protein
MAYWPASDVRKWSDARPETLAELAMALGLAENQKSADRKLYRYRKGGAPLWFYRMAAFYDRVKPVRKKK